MPRWLFLLSDICAVCYISAGDLFLLFDKLFIYIGFDKSHEQEQGELREFTREANTVHAESGIFKKVCFDFQTRKKYGK